MVLLSLSSLFFFFNDTATTEIYTLSLHDALPIFTVTLGPLNLPANTPHDKAEQMPPRTLEIPFDGWITAYHPALVRPDGGRSEEHTSELQSHVNLVCRLLLEKKKNKKKRTHDKQT